MRKINNLSVPLQRCALSVAIGSAFMTMVSPYALGQGSNNSNDELEVLEEVVVTGTLIRGIEPTGALPIGIDSEAITASGAVTTNEILATVPQVTNYFNTRSELDPRGASLTVINRPNLRGLPGFNSASGSTTLVLVDGHRITPVGIDQASVDPDIIPGAVIERVDIVTDGGSSLYGADAVGGVMNFITRKEFEGVKLDVDYGGGDDYDTTDIALTGGTGWGSGSILFSVSHNERDGILNSDRDWAHRGVWTEDGLLPDDTECLEPVGAITTYFNYGGAPTTWTSNPLAPGAGVTAIGEPCAKKDASSLLPEYERDNVWLSYSQKLNSNVSFNAQAYYANRLMTFSSYPEGDTISGGSPNDLMVPGNVGDLYDVAAVGFSYGANSGYRHRDQEIELETWGISPELVIDLESGWQLRQTFHYGRSETSIVDPQSNRSTMLNYYSSGDFDPTDVAAADPNVIRDILNFEYGAKTVQEMFLARIIMDGTVMALPAGEMRMAIGAEYTQDTARKKQGETVVGGLSALDDDKNSRDIKSFFAEVQVPVLDSLDVSFSVRADEYSDFGKTTNPNIGIDFTPTDWLKIFGHWGESYNAPTAVDGLSRATIRNLTFGTAAVVPDPNSERDLSRTNVLQITGATAGTLEPQTAETWAVGFELMPLEGLRLSMTYYDIKFQDILGSPNPQLPSAVLANPEKFIFNPTQADLDYIFSFVDNAEQYPDIIVNELGIIVDRRITNSDQARLNGIDFSLSYQHTTGLGVLGYGLSGNYQKTFEIDSGDGWVDNLEEGVPTLSMAGNLSWMKDNLQARLTMKYTNGFDTSTAALGQTSVDSFLVTDLFVGYQIDESLSLRFNVDNVFDEEPPVWRQSGDNLTYSGFTIGRVFKLGVSKTFF